MKRSAELGVTIVEKILSWSQETPFVHGDVPRHLYHFEPETLRAMLGAAGYGSVTVGGTANPGTLLRHLHASVGQAPTASAPRAVRLLLMAATLPAALALRSKALWAIADKSA